MTQPLLELVKDTAGKTAQEPLEEGRGQGLGWTRAVGWEEGQCRQEQALHSSGVHYTQATPLRAAGHLVLGGEWESVDRNRLSERSASLQQRG